MNTACIYKYFIPSFTDPDQVACNRSYCISATCMNALFLFLFTSARQLYDVSSLNHICCCILTDISNA